MPIAKGSVTRCIAALLFGLLFVLPHLVRMAELGSVREYTPFSAVSPSPTVWDETFLYAAEANYTLQQHRLANDTDSFEHRDEPFPYSILPAEFEAGLARTVGSLGRAQILCHFLFPAITAWLLIGLFAPAETSIWLAGALALFVVVFGFSSRTLVYGDLAFLRQGFGSTFAETLQGARNPNPNMSFPLLLGAGIAAASAIRRRSAGRFLICGLLGGLLFYTYTFYAIAWCAASALLLLLSLWRGSMVPRAVWITLASEGCVALPFFWWKHVSERSGAYLNRTARLGLVHTHALSAAGIRLTLLWGGALAIAGLCWFLLERTETSCESTRRSSPDSSMFLVFVSAALGGIAGMNMQVITGFNLQAENHFPHMVIQPTVILVFGLLFVRVLIAWLGRGYEHHPVLRGVGAGAFVLLFTACAVAQVTAGADTAQFHRMNPSNRMLFKWLGEHSRIGDVVATTSLQLCIELPVYTHNYTLLAEGSRTSGTNEEVIERLLLTDALASTPVSRVAEQLRETDSTPHALPLATHSYFLFEQSPYSNADGHRIFEAAIPPILAEYEHLSLSTELERYRVDYLYTLQGELPAQVAGWRVVEVLATAQGKLWRVVKQ